MRIEYVFLDDGGVINDNRLRAPQWERLVGEFFVPRLGGSLEDWARVNRDEVRAVFVRMEQRFATWEIARDGPLEQAYRAYDVDWLESMLRGLGMLDRVPAAELASLAIEAPAWIQARVRASFPGAAEAIRALSRDHMLFMASGSASWDLEVMLTALGVKDCFRMIYGPDRVDVPKLGRAYYDAIFAREAVDPASCLVLDDHVENVTAAAAAGACSVLVTEEASRGYEGPTLRRLAELPALLETL